jgi:polyphosphate kinase
MSDPTPTDLDDPTLYLNRDLAVLSVIRRVLEQARDATTPILERLRFIAICSTVLDEFFEIRVASHRERAAHGAAQPGPDGRSSFETLEAISVTAHELVEDQYRLLNEVLLPTLEAEGIRLLRRASWTDAQRAWIRRYFEDEVQPVLTTMGLDPAHPFPKILNKSLNFVVLALDSVLIVVRRKEGGK